MYVFVKRTRQLTYYTVRVYYRSLLVFERSSMPRLTSCLFLQVKQIIVEILIL